MPREPSPPDESDCDRCGTAIDSQQSAAVAYQHPIDTKSDIDVAERVQKYLCGDCRERLHVFVNEDPEPERLRYVE